ncbi:hypothetical protein DXT99_10540 [Pontibacter diazotrophicus]|uniref:Uncharacterized protein n=1 Tax=Pontibacter diazotrophicus TaxID=1400979 RepID=A0A3D8LDS8_9BACT|nr:hypothetical protein [Pontibacter diazotrophicus]RDV15102.1 hypothetical protein DXT99_10540 [Pontibacter diazotrophicus]
MKHLFYIHSYITYYVGLEVIKYRKLNHSDCVLMYGRKFKPHHPPVGMQQVDLPFTHHPVNTFAVKRKFWKGWERLRKFDAFVEKITFGDAFKIYTNQTGIDFIRLFISHKKCKGFSFLEEGLYSYHPLDEVNAVLCPAGLSTMAYKVLLYLNYKGRLAADRLFFKPEYDAVYGLQATSFPDFANRLILPNPFINQGESAGIEGAVLVLDALFEYGRVRKGVYKQGLKSAFNYFKTEGITNIWLKLHPEHYNTTTQHQTIKDIIAECGKGVKVDVLPVEVCLERLAGDRRVKQVTFFVFLSSVGMYAALCNRSAFSFAWFIGERDEQYKQRVERLPKAFKEKVKFL